MKFQGRKISASQEEKDLKFFDDWQTAEARSQWIISGKEADALKKRLTPNILHHS